MNRGLQDALAAFQAGDLAEAERLCAAALAAQPDSFDALHLSGLVAARGGDAVRAERLFARAVAINPQIAQARLNHGNALRALNRHEDALASYTRALALKADYAPAIGNRGAVLLLLGRHEEAEAAYRRGIAIAPGDAAMHLGLGNALKELGRLADAAVCFTRAAELRPDFAEAHNNLGTTLKDLGRPDEASASCARAAELKPGDPAVQDNLGAAYYEQGRTDLTVVHYKRALLLKAKAAEASPWTLAVCDALIDLIGLPAIYRDDAEVAASRGNFAAALDRLKALLAERPETSTAEEGLIAECLFKLNHFLLGYQQRDDKPLLQSYCAIAVELLKPRFGLFLRPVGRRPGGGKIRLGVASELLMNHNGANWIYPWLAGLPRDDYEFFLYSLNGRTDWLTGKFATLGAYRWLPFRADSYAKSLSAIRADALDVLILPDVGMTPSSRIIALARLAPIQCLGWGHPITTGSATIDYFLSSAGMEPENGGAHFTETVVKIPNPAFFHDHPGESAPPQRQRFGLPEGKTLLGSVQNLFKYLPHSDDLFARIAEAAPEAVFAFVGHRSAHVTGLFTQRLARAFERRGQRFEDRVRIVPPQPHQAFVDLFDVFDVVLDTPGWNGANTTMFALARGCPVVTLPGEFTRSRHALGLLGKIGMQELAAASEDAYVALAVRLATDQAYRAAVGEKIKSQRDRLLDNAACCRFLDAFFKEKVAALV